MKDSTQHQAAAGVPPGAAQRVPPADRDRAGVLGSPFPDLPRGGWRTLPPASPWQSAALFQAAARLARRNAL